MILSGFGTTVVLTRNDAGLPRIAYWGPQCHAPANKASANTVVTEHTTTGASFTDEATVAGLWAAQHPQHLGAALEIPEVPSLIPTQAEAWSGTPMLNVSRSGRHIFPRFEVTEISESQHTLTVEAADPQAHLSVTLTIDVHAGGLVSQQARLTNHGQALNVDRLWLTFPIPAHASEILSHTGHHLRERSAQRLPVTDGLTAYESWTGRPDFHTPLVLSAGARGHDFTSGRCYTTHVGWSGNVTHFVCRTPYSLALLGGGELLHAGEVELDEGQSYTTPRVFASWGDGLNEASHRYHDYLRHLHGRPLTRRRPITLNTWEAVYFEHNEATLKDLASAAAHVGVERFVVDDGWFMGRRNDLRALGDWQVDPAVWPNGLEPLATHVHDLGMEFGLWFEPEMISPDSELARAHPDWVLAPNTERLPLEGRHQQVLDLSNPDARDYIFDSISALVGACGIDYIKWDHNRFVTEAISAYTGRPAIHTQVHGLYEVLDRLQAEHPGLEIESCSSGGGRIDLGILARTQRVWTSDCTDPLERIRIQQHTSLLVPPEMMGAHVASSPSHITGRESTIDTRVAAAFLEHFGIEWNLLDVPAEDLAALRDWVTLLKQWRDEEGTARLWHSTLVDPALRLDGLVSADGRRGVYRFAALDTSARYPFDPLPLAGLEPHATYRLAPIGDVSRLQRMGHPQAASSPLTWWNPDGVTVKGAFLSEWGVRLPILNPGSIILFSVERVSESKED